MDDSAFRGRWLMDKLSAASQANGIISTHFVSHDEIIVDNFAGGGGVSDGCKKALGRSPDIAINHDEAAIAMHAANHPETSHLIENIWKVNIDDHTNRKPVGFMWASPDCRDFSRAKGGKLTSKSVRSLAWSTIMQCIQLGDKRPRVLCVENVVEFRTRWEDFDKWRGELRKLGYKSEWRELVAWKYGAPTIRKRFILIARRDGQPIVWPQETHGKPDDPDVLAGKKKPWRTAAEIIDWSLPCPSIFDSAAEIKDKHGLRCVRPLKPNTLKRIAAGVVRYVLEAKEPFFVTLGQHGGSNRSANDPMHTVTASRKDQNAVVVPTLVNLTHGGRLENINEPIKTITGANRGEKSLITACISRQFGTFTGGDIEAPLGTITAGGGGKAALVSAFLAQHNTQRNGHNPGRAASEPLATITGRGTQQNVVAAHLISLKGSDRLMQGVDEPHPTVCAGGTHAGLVAAFLTKYYGVQGNPCIDEPLHTVTTKDRFSLVTVNIEGEQYVITDIGMRMLSARELFRAQGFDDDYIIDPDFNGKPLSKTEQVAKCGNSVPPPLVEAIIAANVPELAVVK